MDQVKFRDKDFVSKVAAIKISRWKIRDVNLQKVNSAVKTWKPVTINQQQIDFKLEYSKINDEEDFHEKIITFQWQMNFASFFLAHPSKCLVPKTLKTPY